MKLYYVILICVVFYSCSENYEQYYYDFSKFSRASLREKSWFPNLVDSNCYDLKELHSLETNSSFGRFSFKNRLIFDSIFSNDQRYESVNLESFIDFLGKISEPKKPDWFLSNNQLLGNGIYRKESMYFVKDNKESTIYFVYSTEK